MDMLNNNFAPANVEKVLADYGYTLDWLDGFFLKRPAYAVTHLAEEFGLTGSLETVTVTTAHPEMGSVTVNTSLLDLSSGSWSGQYFTDGRRQRRLRICGMERRRGRSRGNGHSFC